MGVLVSVHVPKAGGVSITRMLRNAFGEAFQSDYAENPAHPLSPRVLDPTGYMSRKQTIPEGVQCLHGHFHPGKYAFDAQAFLFTLLRHPVDNIISIFFFWKQMPANSEPLHDYFLKNELDIIQTARLPLLRTLYSETYFGDFDMSRFDLIGRHENRESALAKLARQFNVGLDATIRDNVTPHSEERLTANSETRLRSEFESILLQDMRFYDRHAR
jgi:hypothetical protein